MERKIKCAVFDLDGTLVNTIDDLGNTCNFLIEKYGYKYVWNKNDYKKFVGNGAKKLVERAFGGKLSGDELERIYAEFKVIYERTMLDNAYAYEGIKEQLDILKSKGIKLCVVTNKPNIAAQGMVEHFFGKGYFDVISGVVDGKPTKPDPYTTLLALKSVGCLPDEAIYFGDSNVDMRTARNAGIEAVGVTWGFRSFEELFAENPSVIIDKPEYISKLI
ncbi:MAG: HAD family hydrolase [Ruminococcaceae bacterium]|nr:HAD family hydrolase [Oscillospiraceae bacterium]